MAENSTMAQPNLCSYSSSYYCYYRIAGIYCIVNKISLRSNIYYLNIFANELKHKSLVEVLICECRAHSQIS